MTAFFAASVFAYAGGIGATVDSFVAKLMTKFSGTLLDICDMLVSPIFSITTMTVSEIAAYIPGFNTTGGSGAFFVEGIQMLGTCLAGCLAMFGILKIIIGLARDEKVGSIGSLIWRMFIFIPLTIFGRKLLQGLFDQVITPISSAFAAGVLDFSNNAVFSTAAAPLTGNASQLATLIVGTILMVMIGYNLIGLVLEAAERYLNQIWQATRTADAGGAALTEENAGTSATLGFNVKPDTRSNDGIGAQAANAFMSGGTMEQLTQQSDEALAHHAQMEADKSAAWGDLNTMGNDDRVAQMRDENSTVDYSSAGYRAATAEYMQQNGLDDGMIERGGEIVAQQVTEDGRLVGCIAVKDAENNALEEKFYSLSTAASSVDSASASAPTMDEVLTAKYQMIDEGHGMVETSDLGKLQVSRVSVNEATGDTKWQVIRKGSESEFDGPESEDAIATFERKGNHGIAQSFKDVIRDIRNTRTFDQISLIDSKNKDRPDDSHLFR